MKSFLWRTLLSGLLVVVPATIIIVVLVRATAWIRATLESIAASLPMGAWFHAHWPMAWALLALLLVCLLTGLILNLAIVQNLVASANRTLSKYMPLYAHIRGFEASYLGKTGHKLVQSALVEMDETLAPAFVAEELPDGRYVIFVPATPSIRDGCIYVMTRERVHLIDASARQVAHCIRHWGVGTGRFAQDHEAVGNRDIARHHQLAAFKKGLRETPATQHQALAMGCGATEVLALLAPLQRVRQKRSISR